MTKKEIPIGEKYLTIYLEGHNKVYAFMNKEKKDGEPDFKGRGVGVYVNEKKKTSEESVL